MWAGLGLGQPEHQDWGCLRGLELYNYIGSGLEEPDEMVPCQASLGLRAGGSLGKAIWPHAECWLDQHPWAMAFAALQC